MIVKAKSAKGFIQRPADEATVVARTINNPNLKDDLQNYQIVIEVY